VRQHGETGRGPCLPDRLSLIRVRGVARLTPPRVATARNRHRCSGARTHQRQESRCPRTRPSAAQRPAHTWDHSCWRPGDCGTVVGSPELDESRLPRLAHLEPRGRAARSARLHEWVESAALPNAPLPRTPGCAQLRAVAFDSRARIRPAAPPMPLALVDPNRPARRGRNRYAVSEARTASDVAPSWSSRGR